MPATVFWGSIDYDDYVELPAGVREEILFAALLLPLAHADIRAPLDPEVSATDATPDSRGSCVASISKNPRNGILPFGRTQGGLHTLGHC